MGWLLRNDMLTAIYSTNTLKTFCISNQHNDGTKINVLVSIRIEKAFEKLAIDFFHLLQGKQTVLSSK